MWRAFGRLRSTRVNVMSMGHIAWHESLRWAKHEGLDEEETESLIDLIEKLDQEEHRLDDEKKDRENGPDGKTGNRGRQPPREGRLVDSE